MSSPTPDMPDRRALIIYYDDERNEVEVYAEEFSPLEVPELLRVALDLSEADLPCPVDTDTEE